MIKLSPSILSADFTALGEHIRALEIGGADMLHFDVMDGHFVPNLSFGIPVLESLRGFSHLPIDVHLMINNPLSYLEAYAQAGADAITVHWETVSDMPACLSVIRSLDVTTAFAINPSTPVEDVLFSLEQADRILIMSVEPGLGGQKFIPDTLRKAEKIAEYISKKGLRAVIQMDGGIYLHNVQSVIDAGVSIVVAGSAINAKTPQEVTEKTRLFVQAINK